MVHYIHGMSMDNIYVMHILLTLMDGLALLQLCTLCKYMHNFILGKNFPPPFLSFLLFKGLFTF